MYLLQKVLSDLQRNTYDVILGSKHAPKPLFLNSLLGSGAEKPDISESSQQGLYDWLCEGGIKLTSSNADISMVSSLVISLFSSVRLRNICKGKYSM